MDNSILDIKLRAAINEIEAAAQQLLHKEVIGSWLAEYKDLSVDLSTETRGQVTQEMTHGITKCKFERIYLHLSMLLDYYNLEPICETAMNEYEAILSANAKSHDSLRLLLWLRKYEKLGLEELLEPPIEGETVNNVRTIYDVAYVVPGSDFKKSMEFYYVFSHLFWEEKMLPDSLAKFRGEM